MAHYKSDITQFLEALKTEHPHLEEAQQEGRSLLWDQTPISMDEQQRNQIARVKQKPYVYQ